MTKLRFLLLGAAAALVFGQTSGIGAETEKSFVYTAADEVQFKSPLGIGPAQAVLFGDPSKPGVYVVRVRFPPGHHSNPHFHSRDRHAVVVEGVWWNGVGDTLDFKGAAGDGRLLCAASGWRRALGRRRRRGGRHPDHWRRAGGDGAGGGAGRAAGLLAEAEVSARPFR